MPFARRLFWFTSLVVSVATAARATTFDLSTATIGDINQAMDAGALTSEKLVTLYLARLSAYDKQGPKINSVITLNPKALEEARAMDAERKAKGPRSPLHGIPVMVKDLIDVAGLPTSAGFKPFGAPIPPRDSGVVERLHKAGAIILAKAATVNWFGRDGFGESHPIGKTLNPYNVDYQTGGTSNGVGASMACYFGTVGIGTDTSGSVQNPSSYCSLVGMVATQGMVTRTGIVPRGPTQDRAGPMGRSVYDIAAELSIMAGWDAEDLGTSPGLGHFPQGDWSKELGAPNMKGKRVGVLREMFSNGIYDEEVKAIFDRALEDMRKAGAIIVDPVLTGLDLRITTTNQMIGMTHPRSLNGEPLPYELVPSTNAYFERLGPNRPWKTLQEMVIKVGPEKVTEEYAKCLTFLEPDKMPDYVSRHELKEGVIHQIVGMIENLRLDALVLPYQAVPPPPWDSSKDKYTAAARANNLTSATGLPGIIMPGGYSKGNLPISIQFVGKPFDDLKLLQVAYGYEQSSKRRKSPEIVPPLPGEKFDY